METLEGLFDSTVLVAPYEYVSLGRPTGRLFLTQPRTIASVSALGTYPSSSQRARASKAVCRGCRNQWGEDAGVGEGTRRKSCDSRCVSESLCTYSSTDALMLVTGCETHAAPRQELLRKRPALAAITIPLTQGTGYSGDACDWYVISSFTD